MASAERTQYRQQGSNLRQKRRQVARACDGCRTHRIKCDDSFPCSNCKARGQKCTNLSTNQRPTSSAANREISRLEQRVQELEAEVERERQKSANLSRKQIARPLSNPPPPPYQQRTIHGYSASKNGRWDGIHIRPARSPNGAWFGASSLYHFIHRLSLHLTSTAKGSLVVDNMIPTSEGRTDLLNRSASERENQTNLSSFDGEDTSSTATFLNPAQEGYFISLFWEGYHACFFPIINEADFKEHYQSLWKTAGTARKSSALADMIIATCMQYGLSILPSEQQGAVGENIDATMAGRWYYQRSQALLAFESDSPTITTMQCHMLCAVYLCGASFHNMTDNSIALAVRAAYMLGLHLDSPQGGISEQENQLRKRLWWAVYALDARLGMKLGRPFLIPNSQSMPDLPRDDFEASTLSGSMFAPIGESTTWLSFNLQMTKLYILFRAAHEAFYDSDFDLNFGKTIWDDPRNLEASADILTTHTKGLQEWVDNVPIALKTSRQHHIPAFSVDISGLEIEQFAPQWLQRQRIVLESTYHHLCINLFRPFVSFNSKPCPGGLAESYSTRCVGHAIALSKITHQVLSTTSILNGWHDAFQYQWNAAMTLVGFVLVQPQAALASDARHAIDLSVAIFDIFKANFSIAGNASNIVRSLCAKLDHVQKSRERKIAPLNYSIDAVQQIPSQGDYAYSGNEAFQREGFQIDTSVSRDPIQFDDLVYGMDGDLFDMAVDIDFWANLDDLLLEV
ncbi:fungal-specific transcription factor domain-containing protein, partial [Talaromyces proteolyticus]